VYRNALYFYSAPSSKDSFTFYRATVDHDYEIIQFTKINEIRTTGDTIHFAHQQPLYVLESEKRRLYGFEDGVSWSIPPIKPHFRFFQHRGILFMLRQGDAFHVQGSPPIPGNHSVEITVPNPENTAVHSPWNTRFLYILTNGQLYVFLGATLE
ncbi:hypothetical protein PENTCL1PPCAC_8581, partial [Pristionchus entomophagus]